MLEPRPAFTDAVQDQLCPALSDTSAVVRLTISNRSSVSTATCRLRPTIVLAPLLGEGRLDRLAVQHAACGARFAPGLLAVDHERHIVDRAKQQAAYEATEPPVHFLPGAELARQHAPAAGAARHVPDRVQDFAKVHAWLTPGLRPRGGDLGISGAIRFHSASVRSDGYRRVLRAMSVIRLRVSRVNIPSLNNNPRATTTTLKRSLPVSCGTQSNVVLVD